jgi:glycosyltransferase involved in cell wall biosynthesis
VALRVGLNALHVVPEETGGSELYARRLVPALLATRSARLTLFTSREGYPSFAAEPWAGELELVRLPVNARGRTRRVLAEQTLFPRELRRRKLDLLHNLVTTAPALPGVPQVTTILDVIYKHFPETQRRVFAYGLRLLVPLAARRSRRVLALSEAGKADIVRFLGVDPARVDVTYLGPGLADVDDPLSEAEVRRALGLGASPIVLTVSTKRPHKNLDRLISAFERLDEASAPVLVLPGFATEFEPALRRRAEASPSADRIHVAGWLDDRTLDALYRAADCFVFPSLAEGFGLPVLEALRRGTPVACSSASSLPEVAGEAAVYFDPLDTEEIAGAMRELLSDTGLRERLAAAGPQQAAPFTWDATAAATLASYERAAADSASTRS